VINDTRITSDSLQLGIESGLMKAQHLVVKKVEKRVVLMADEMVGEMVVSSVGLLVDGKVVSKAVQWAAWTADEMAALSAALSVGLMDPLKACWTVRMTVYLSVQT